MTDDRSEQSRRWAAAATWVSRVFAVVAEMLLPGLAGIWLDERNGTQFYTLIGFAVGLTLAIFHLIRFQKLTLERNRQDMEPKPPVDQTSLGEN